jgi:multiple antibiotic resistance protein
MLTEHISFSTLTISIFILLNSYSQIPIFLSLTSQFDAKRQRNIIIREMIFALVILITFTFFGSEALKVIGIKQPIIGMAGGLLLVIISLNMIFPKENTDGLPKHEPFIVPLAIPCIAGPGAITSLMVFAKQQGTLFAAGALFLAWIPSTLILLSSSVIKNYLGEKGLQALERLGGMLIVLIGIQMAAIGVIDLIKESF